MCECGDPTYTDKCELCFIDDAVKLDITRSLPMNARIKELAWSVGIAGKNGKGQIDTDWDHLEKFAELLVKECVDVTFDYDIEEAGEVIKEHFGVK